MCGFCCSSPRKAEICIIIYGVTIFMNLLIKIVIIIGHKYVNISHYLKIFSVRTGQNCKMLTDSTSRPWSTDYNIWKIYNVYYTNEHEIYHRRKSRIPKLNLVFRFCQYSHLCISFAVMQSNGTQIVKSCFQLGSDISWNES